MKQRLSAVGGVGAVNVVTAWGWGTGAWGSKMPRFQGKVKQWHLFISQLVSPNMDKVSIFIPYFALVRFPHLSASFYMQRNWIKLWKGFVFIQSPFICIVSFSILVY